MNSVSPVILHRSTYTHLKFVEMWIEIMGPFTFLQKDLQTWD